MIGMDGKRESGNYILQPQLNDDDDDCNILTNKREITSDATGVTAPTTSGGFGQ